jgi:putative PIN family toxin of toxin-antitoxin system
MQVVLDPCVLIAAAISPRGTAARLLAACRGGGPRLVVSPHLLWELRVVLARHKFRSYLSLEDANRFVQGLADAALVVADPPTEHGVTRDPGDDYLVSLARAAGASYLVSVDHHLTDVRGLLPPVVGPGWLLGRLAGMRATGARSLARTCSSPEAAYSAVERTAVHPRRAAASLTTTPGRQQACVRR